MCVIVLQPEGAHLEKDRAERLWAVNPDGGGFAFVDDDGELAGYKSMEFKEFWKAFEMARSAYPKRDFLIHMRIATHGTVSLDNVHPFRVGEDAVMAHNGIIHGAPDDPEKLKSDTRMFIQEILPQLPEQWLDKPLYVDMLQEWLGWSKLVFLTVDPELQYAWYIVNEKAGDWVDKMWFSNKTGVHKPVEYKSSNVTGFASYKGKKREARKAWESKSPTPTTWSQPSEATLHSRWDDDDDFMAGKGWEPMSDETMKAYEQIAIPLGNNVSLTKDEASVFLELLVEERQHVGLEKPIVWDHDGEVTCNGCDEFVDLITGDCQCWDKFCTDCTEIAGLCKCKGGFSSNLKLWSELERS